MIVAIENAKGDIRMKDWFGEMHMVCPQHGLADCACHLIGTAET